MGRSRCESTGISEKSQEWLSHSWVQASLRSVDKGEVDYKPSRPSGIGARLFPTGFLPELKAVARLAVALMFVQVCQIGMQPLSTMFGGHLGKVELDAVGLANSIINVLGNSLINGLGTACDTIFSQTYGSTNRASLGVQLQRGLVVIFFAMLPFYAIHLNAESLLLLMGQDPLISRLVGRYLLMFTPGLVSLYFYVILRKYVQCQSIVLPHIAIGALGLGVQAVAQYLMLYYFRLGLDGSALAQSLGYFVMMLATLTYILASGLYKSTWSGWDWHLFEDWGTFAKLAAYGALMFMLEWFAFELVLILSGLLGTTDLAATSVVFNIDCVCVGIPTGMGVALSIVIGQYLGANSPQNAKTVARVGMIMLVITGAAFTLLLFLLRYQLPKLFTNDREIIDLSAEMLVIVSVYYLFCSASESALGIIRGSGQQAFGFVVILVGYYFVACPIGIPLMFKTTLKTLGFWIGLAIALFLVVIVFFVYLGYYLNWSTVAVQAQERVGATDTEDSTRSVMSADTLPPDEEAPLINTASRKQSEITPFPIYKSAASSRRKHLFITRTLAMGVSVSILVFGILCRLFVEIPVEPSWSNATLAYSNVTTELYTASIGDGITRHVTRHVTTELYTPSRGAYQSTILPLTVSTGAL